MDRVGAAVPGAGGDGVPALLHLARHGLRVGALRRRLPRHLHRLPRRIHDHQGGVGQLRGHRGRQGESSIEAHFHQAVSSHLVECHREHLYTAIRFPGITLLV